MSDYLRSMTFKLTPAEVQQIKELGEKHHYRGFWTANLDENDKS